MKRLKPLTGNANLCKAFKESIFAAQLVVVFFLLTWGSKVQGQALNGSEFKIYSRAEGKEISLQALVQSLEGTDVLFFGEQHRDSIGHMLQDTVYALMLQNYQQVALSLEMFETDCQQILDEYLAGYITESKMTNDARAWKNYPNAYRPLVERAKMKGQRVVAANAPRRYVNLVGRKGLSSLGELPKASRKYLAPLPIQTENPPYFERFKEVMSDANHEVSYSVYEAQCTWDATMAHRIHLQKKKDKKSKVLHLNGRFHTDYQQGTVSQLRAFNKKLNIKNISSFSIPDLDQPEWDSYGEIGDYIIVTKSME